MILETIDSPADLRDLSTEQLTILAREIRDEMVRVTAQVGGHLGAGLGVVELTLALHRLFESPREKIVWDVGHQAYPHKLITGRRERFGTIRQTGGISGFLAREESEHDAFGAGHASTSISAALGMATANALRGDRTPVVAVIGDAALTGGMAYEALNNAGQMRVPLIVVLNDNGMSISPNVGGITRYLNRIRANAQYNQLKGLTEDVLGRLPAGDTLVEIGRRLKDGFKEFVVDTLIWEELGFAYLGPVDGHDIPTLLETLAQARRMLAEYRRPVFVHVVTEKGHGMPGPDPSHQGWHSVSPPSGKKPAAPKYQDVFAKTLITLAETDEKIVAITAAMPSGTGLDKFQQVYPKRFFDVGIAEQHAVTFAAGLACGGMRPVAAIYSTFLQRAFDQIVHDVCMQHLPVIFCLDRAGLVGDDGRTHQGIFDLSYLRCVPNMTILAPKDENELQHMVATAVAHTSGPIAVRYPRGNGVGVAMDPVPTPLPIGKGETLREGGDVALIAAGTICAVAVAAAEALAHEGIAATVINARSVKPLDEALLLDAGRRTGRVITLEENVVKGGFGAAVLELYAREGLAAQVRTLGVPDQMIEHGPQPLQREWCGLTAEHAAEVARELLGRRAPAKPARKPDGAREKAADLSLAARHDD
ncbi:MAG TPA: 1-deoxy-D-xylulose-5-phosphate synthase [Thermomicrobiales bacterium]|nr:1-deoxy-D-xylulose-5-phosphate synthase [Thermomicrobiales bacterium]